MNANYRPMRIIPKTTSAPVQAPRSNRRLLINPRFQLTFLGWSFLMLAVTTGTFYAGIQYFFQKFMQIAQAAGLPADHTVFQFLNAQKMQMDQIFILTAVAAGVVLFFGAIYLSHRVAGPVFRLVDHLEKMAAGETVEDVKFRKNDFFPELARACNQQFELFRKFRKKATRKIA